jgi:hypothetical protein
MPISLHSKLLAGVASPDLHPSERAKVASMVDVLATIIEHEAETSRRERASVEVPSGAEEPTAALASKDRVH